MTDSLAAAVKAGRLSMEAEIGRLRAEVAVLVNNYEMAKESEAEALAERDRLLDMRERSVEAVSGGPVGARQPSGMTPPVGQDPRESGTCRPVEDLSGPVGDRELARAVPDGYRVETGRGCCPEPTPCGGCGYVLPAGPRLVPVDSERTP